jgi:hypothetical protein
LVTVTRSANVPLRSRLTLRRAFFVIFTVIRAVPARRRRVLAEPMRLPLSRSDALIRQAAGHVTWTGKPRDARRRARFDPATLSCGARFRTEECRWSVG